MPCWWLKVQLPSSLVPHGPLRSAVWEEKICIRIDFGFGKCPSLGICFTARKQAFVGNSHLFVGDVQSGNARLPCYLIDPDGTIW